MRAVWFVGRAELRQRWGSVVVLMLLGALGLLFGIPLGVIVGRFAWDQIADGAGLGTVTVIPAAALVVVAIGTLVIVNVVAYIPGRRAARRPPAAVLRSE